MAATQKVDPVGFAGFALTAMTSGSEGLIYLGTPLYSHFKAKNVGESPVAKYQSVVCVGREQDTLLIAPQMSMTAMVEYQDIIPASDLAYVIGRSNRKWYEAWIDRCFFGTLKQNLLTDADVLIDGVDLSNLGQATETIQTTLISTTSISLVDITGLNLTLTTKGKVLVLAFLVVSGSAAGITVVGAVFRDITNLGERMLMTETVGMTGGYRTTIGCAIIDSPSAGSHTYKVQWRVTGGTGYSYFRSIAAVEGRPA